MPVAIDAAMKTLIEGGWVVAFNGKSHEVHEQGSVVFENDRIVHAGGPYTGAVDTRLSARGKLVSPGFINTHVHTTGNGGDYLLLDMAKNDYRTANYMSFAAPLKGKMTPPPPEAVAALRTFVFLHAIKQGTTTIIDVGGQRGDWEGYVRLVDELDVRVHTHAGGNLVEFQRIMDEYRKTPIQFLADIGFLDDRSLIGHGVFTTAHPWSHYPFGDDLRVLAERGATVGHCPYKYAKMAMTLNSFQRYLDAGVNVAIGTDTFPMDMVAELRWTSILAKVADANYQAGQHRDVFNAATLAGCKFLHRDDLGRLGPGAKADIVLINLDHLGAGVYADPIKALIDAGSGRDVDTVIVDGKILVQGGRTTRIDEDEVYARAREVTERFWSNVPTWRWDGAPVDRIIPPAFPIHGAATK